MLTLQLIFHGSSNLISYANLPTPKVKRQKKHYVKTSPLRKLFIHFQQVRHSRF